MIVMLTRNKRGRIGLALAAIAGLLIATPLGAHAAGLLIADGGFGGVLEIKEQDVKVTINNGIAVTEINQVFVNTENRQVEALYTFPVPKGASVANFSMWINGKEMIGEVVEKERAREIYNSYKKVRRDPGLLEQTDYKTFEMRIFPIGPNAEQRVRVTYYQQLDYDHNWGTYVYPLATVTRTNIDQRTTGKFALTMDIRSAVPIVSMGSPSHGDMVVTAEHADDYWQASLETDGGDLARDVVIAYEVARPITGLDLVTSKQRGEDGFFLLTLTAGEELAEADGGGADYVFVLDVSGSMAHDGKLRLSRESLGAFIDQLGKGDRFELVVFNVKPTTLFSSLADTGDDNKARATEFLDSQQARGGTSLHPAITTAYKYGDPDRDLNVVILSDGMTEQRERRELSELIGQRPANARVFCIGIGNEVNRPLLEQIADDAGGIAAFVSHGDDFERQAKAFRRKLMHPVATGLAIDFPGADVYDIEPQQLPNLYHGAPIRVFGRYRNGAAVDAKVTGEVRGKPISTTAKLDFPKAEAGNTEIERMWAWHRIDRLLKDGDRKGSRASVTDEVIRLGEAFSIASEYTSFIVLENDSEYGRWKIDRRNALRVKRDRAGREQVQEQLTRLRRKAADEMGPVAPTTLASGERVKPGVTNQVIDTRQAQAPVEPRRRVDLDVNDNNKGGGGGAIDPFTAALAVGLGGLAVRSRRKWLGKSNTGSGS
jgi:Ca-activated chloride channel homolog